MSKKTGVIVATIGMFVVLVTLIGITYGFYMSLISGNETSKNVTLQAGESEVTFTDLSEEETTEIIAPGYKNTKYFIVQNTGEISSSYYIHLVDVTNEYIRKEDIVYTLYRKVGNNNVSPQNFDTTNVDLSTWENISSNKCPINSQYPSYGDCQYLSSNGLIITDKETIETSGDYYVYAFVVEYINQPEIDQIDDETSVFSGRIKIFSDETGVTKSPFLSGTLADAIFDNALAGTNGTIYSENPITTPGEQPNLETEKTLSATVDDDGVSYYFRGNVQNNYVNFAGMCWKIVRIQGDGSIKLILEDYTYECDDESYSGRWNISDVAYADPYEIDFIKTKYLNQQNQQGMVKGFKNYQTTIAKKIDQSIGENPTIDQVNNVLSSKLKDGDWCLDDSAYSDEKGMNQITDFTSYIDNRNSFYYGAYTRIAEKNTPTLKCNSTPMSKFNDNGQNSTPMYVATLTADEIVFAGAIYGNTENYNYYLMNELSKCIYDSDYGMERCGPRMWTLSPKTGNLGNESIFVLTNYGYLDNYDLIDYNSIRPSISLKSGIKVLGDGEGLKTDPYIVE